MENNPQPDHSVRVSICLPTLNARRFLEPRIDSIFGQTLTDWELIVCDSFSDDGTWDYLQPYTRDSRVRMYRVPREGLYAGWNECLRRCRGTYVYLATADDTCKPDLLEKLVDALEAGGHQGPGNLPADIAVCNFDYIDERGEVIKPPLPPAGEFYGDWRYREHRRSGYVEFLVHLLIGTSWTTMTAVVFRRSLLEKVGLFRTDAGALADRFWAYQSALRSDTLVVPETLATWRQHGSQGSGTRKSLRELRQLMRVTEQTLNACDPWLPAEWKRDPHYRDKLLWSERRHYLDHYRLTRTDLRYRPENFLRGCLSAAVLEPAFLFRRLVSGLAWEPDCNLNETAYLKRLMEAWKIAWPPE
ncbi:MAG: hypothetical protein A2498_13780 [Lentisphaerae bacterium RIFOXYC12_FULL_60_16]|nr:MAG: hypothetical protein A2498_13780 [Lentisphaerae bacterium RIFOXYC12_FULL_60_16]